MRRVDAVKRLCLALALAGCAGEAEKRRTVAARLETLSRDQCLASSLSDPTRARLRQAALDGRITRDDVDRYLSEVKVRAERARGQGTEQTRFCPIQLEVWRRYFGG
jgi:hypothetical protein